jgi:hypothetical protein
MNRGLAGQAMVEMAVALVVILILFAGLLQIGRLTTAHTQTMITARESAGYSAMSEEFLESGGSAYISGWGAGSDDKSYTADDIVFSATNASEAVEETAFVARPDELAVFVPDTPFAPLPEAVGSTNIFYLVHGQGQWSISTIPVIRSLIYNRSSIFTRSDAWLVWTQGIY